MKRLICVAILAVIVMALCFTGTTIINNCGKNVGKLLKQAFDAAEAGNIDTARELAKQAESEFVRYEEPVSMFVHLDLVEQMGTKIAGLADLAAEETITEFCAEAQDAITMLTHIVTDEKPKLTNIF